LPWTTADGRHSIGSGPTPAALPSGQAHQQDQESWRAAPPGQSPFRTEGQPAGQRDPYQAGQPGWQSAEGPASAAWSSPVASPDGPPNQSAAQRGGAGWDGGRWNPAPATGPVIEGSVLDSGVLDSGPADLGRTISGSYPGQPDQYSQPAQYGESAPYNQSGQYNQPAQYNQSAQYNQPAQYSQRDLDSQADWRGRHTRNEGQASVHQQAPAGGTDWPPQDWPPQDWPAQDQPAQDQPAQPRIAASGLPIRTPRAATPPSAPLSPSGSLWERAESEPAGYQDASGYEGTGGYQNTGQESGGRPIYVWNPADRPSRPGYPPATE
jgi:hypothetical protein